ncbi:hypothetical protein HRI_002542400 [Hibiscus trionum]|uniref:DNA-binding protein RHL1 n=1 Tax=Hibiscus trionum TaxID=183268 RepID=A0A9W7M7V3_HIBTR|nr:hypothetical protein HRI_002542400 [Hibiscus trionum]
MVRASSFSKAQTPEGTERKKLKKLALKNDLLSEKPPAPKSYAPLRPSNQVIKHHGKDILRKSQRKSRFLFSFPGLLAPISGGRIGELNNLGSQNPILYLDFPQGQMKLFGTIVYPKNRHLSLLFSRCGKNAMCEDYFDNMIVFSDAWWIGKKDENPKEEQLDFPEEMFEGQKMEYDFKGGAGVASVNKQRITKTEIKEVDMEFLDTDSEDALSDESNLKAKIEVTPTRHSARNAGKIFKFAEVSSEDDSIGSDTEPFDGEEKKTISSVPVDLGSDDTEDNQVSEQIQSNLTSVTNSRKTSQSTATVTKSKENSNSSHGSLVQATISTMFKKVEQKGPRGSEKSSSSKVSGKKLRCKNSGRKTDQDGSSKKGKITEGRTTGIKRRKKESEVEDDIEEISSTSQDTSGSDEDWTA